MCRRDDRGLAGVANCLIYESLETEKPFLRSTTVFCSSDSRLDHEPEVTLYERDQALLNGMNSSLVKSAAKHIMHVMYCDLARLIFTQATLIFQ